MDVFSFIPDSGAPTFYAKKSELVIERAFAPWQRTSNWHPDIDEANVYFARLQHKSLEERSWELGIGKGGQIYSMCSSFGEAMAPSSPTSQWNDEVWQFTTIYASLLGHDLPENKADSSRMKFANAFVHQSGTYTKGKKSKAFYSPILADHHREDSRAFSVVSWGQIPSPSINRSGILTYAQYRDLGAGVIEVTYAIYNFEDAPMSNLGPWGGVRTSVFPEQVISNPNGSYRFFTPWSYNTNINFEDTGGWAAAVQNADNPSTHAIAVVFGKHLDQKGLHRGKPRYDSGNSRHGQRDYTVQATVININDKPRTLHLLRMYFVIDTLHNATEKANRLADFADYEPLDLKEAGTPLVPLHFRKVGKDRVLSRTGRGKPACSVYAWPVTGSYPLFLVKNNQSGGHFITTDPYAQCAQEPFINPLKPGDKGYEKYQNRTIYRFFEEKTALVELLGFVMPRGGADNSGQRTMLLADVPGVAPVFDAGRKRAAGAIRVIAP